MFNPKVSIIIPVYNGSNYIRDAIDSALKQDYDNYEIIVVNDGSNDNDKTKNICMSYGKKIRYFEKENGGVSSALNYGISKMNGRYFSWLSHDDLYYENKLSCQIKELEKYDENTVLYSNYSIVNENGTFIKNVILNHDEYNKKPYNSIFNMDINGITLLIPKKAFDECGFFDETLRCIQDYDLWYKMIKKYKFVHMKDVLGSTRVHSNQVSNVSPKVITEGNSFYKKLVDEFDKELKIKYDGSEYLFLDNLERKLRFNSKYIEAADYIKEKKNILLKEYKIDFEKIPVCWLLDSGIVEKNQEEFIFLKEYPNLNIKQVKENEKVNLSDYKYIYIGNKDINIFEYIKLLELSKADMISDYLLDDEKIFNLDKYSKFVHTDLQSIIIRNKKSINFDLKNKFNLILNTVEEGRILLYKKSSGTYDDEIKNIKNIFSLVSDKLIDEEFANLCYQVAVIYNKNCDKTLNNKVKFYEECEKYQALSYSRAWKLYNKIMKFLKRKI